VRNPEGRQALGKNQNQRWRIKSNQIDSRECLDAPVCGAPPASRQAFDVT
jgi:hypothetical protein